jgi:hypothetical protein
MLTSVKGTYQHGKVILDEPLPTSYAKVIVTVVEEIERPKLEKRTFGIIKNATPIPDDFNEPLEDLKDYM